MVGTVHDPDPSDSGPFVGRSAEIDATLTLLDDMLAGQGRLLLVTGEPGIGKTRFVENIAARAGQRGVDVLVGHCRRDGAAAYTAWSEILWACVERGQAAELAADMGGGAAMIAQLVPEIRKRLFGLPVVPTVAADQAGHARVRLFDSVVSFLEKTSRRRPLLLVLEDLQWSDASSVLLLQALVRAMSNSRLLVLGTYRDVEVGAWHRLSTTLEALAQEAVTRRIVLPGLDIDTVAALAQRLTNRRPEPELIRALHHDTAGNPFFVAEALRLLGNAQNLEGRSLRIPDNVRDVVAQRIEIMPPETRRLLILASVIGRDFRTATLANAADMSGTALHEPLAEAVAARLIRHDTDDGFRFAHALVREALYDNTAATHRADLHRRIAVALEAEPQDRASPAELAHHYRMAAPADAEKAVHYACLAGDEAKEAFAYEDAARHYEVALASLDDLDMPHAGRRCMVLMRLGDALRRNGESEAARQTYSLAIDAARSAGDAQLFAAAALGFSGVGAWLGMSVGVTDAARVAHLEEALAQLGPTDSASRARVMARLAMELYWTSERRGEREALSRAAVAMARRLGDEHAMLTCLNSLRWSVWSPDNPEERLAIGAELLALSQKLGERESELQARNWRMIDQIDLGLVPEFDIELDAFEQLADELQQPYYAWWARMRRFTRAMMKGQYDDAEAFAVTALQVAQEMNEPMAQQTFGLQMVALRQQQGRLNEVTAAVMQFAEAFPAIPAWRCGLAYIFTQLGELDAARKELEAVAHNDFIDLPRNDTWLSAIACLAEVALALRDQPRAVRLYSLLLPYASRFMTVSVTCYGSMAFFLGRLADFLERFGDAEVHFEQALRTNQALNAPPFVAETQHAFAAMLLNQDAGRHRERADTLLWDAEAITTRLGMVRLDGLIQATRALPRGG